MKLYKKFNKLPRLVQFLLLVIPFVNWVTEIAVRWTHALDKKDIISVVLAIIATCGGVVLGYIDLVWVILNKHLVWVK